MVSNNINNQLRQLREKLLYSQLQLSVVAGISPSMIVAIEKYGYQPRANVRAKLANSLGVTESDIWPELLNTQ